MYEYIDIYLTKDCFVKNDTVIYTEICIRQNTIFFFDDHIIANTRSQIRVRKSWQVDLP